jgi:uncharacterized damage-inducible protein DinB
MNKNIIAQLILKELLEEVSATRKCLERVPENLYDYKPHEKSMQMGYLSTIVAEVPKWINITIEKGEIDFATWEKYKLSTNADLLKYFDQNVELAKNSLQNVSDEELRTKMFYLKMGGKELMKSQKDESIASELRHWVHHRGQLTVYMRLNNIPVPSIYGPSADENTFK